MNNSKRMRSVRQKNTKPEIRVRKHCHRLGLRFRLHRKDLPGSPDLVFPRHNIALFVHGCFWHRHTTCSKATMPKSNREFWREKFNANVARDARAIRELKNLGWHVAVVWECETVAPETLKSRLQTVFSHVVFETFGDNLPQSNRNCISY